MMDGMTPEEIGKLTPAEKFEFSYNRVLDGFLQTVDEWARLSLAHDEGKLTAEEVVEHFNEHVSYKGFVLLLLDDIRKAKQSKNIDAQVKKFREQLTKLPEADDK